MDEEKSIINNKEKEMRILSTLPMVIDWFHQKKELTDQDFEKLRKLFPEQYEFAVNITFENLTKMNSRYKDSKVFGKQIEILLSPEGIKWLRRQFSRLKEFHIKSMDNP